MNQEKNELHYRAAKVTKPDDLYADRDIEAPGMMEHFMRHLDRITIESLHSKSDIAAELAYRDAELRRLHAENEQLKTTLAAKIEFTIGSQSAKEIVEIKHVSGLTIRM